MIQLFAEYFDILRKTNNSGNIITSNITVQTVVDSGWLRAGAENAERAPG